MADAPRRSNRRGSTSVPTRRKRVWFFSENVNTHVGNDNAAFDILSGARSALGVGGFPGWTLAAIVGQVYPEVSVVQPGIAVDCRLGIVPGTQGQAAANLPIPYVDEGDFLWTNTEYYQIVDVSAIGWGVRRVIEVRTKAQRKLEEIEDTLWFVSRQNNTSDITVRWRLRILLLAP